MKKGIVVYDSWSGNTKKIAEAIGSVTSFDVMKVDDAPSDLKNYDVLVLGTLNVRASPSEKILTYISKVTPPKHFAVFVTFGMPVWGQISSIMCLKDMRRQLEAKGSRFVGRFMCPGYHVKYKTYQGRPCDKDLVNAEKFSKDILAVVDG